MHFFNDLTPERGRGWIRKLECVVRLPFFLLILLALIFNASFALSGEEGSATGVNAAFTFEAETQAAITSSGQVNQRFNAASVDLDSVKGDVYKATHKALPTLYENSSGLQSMRGKSLASIVATNTESDSDNDGIPDSDDIDSALAQITDNGLKNCVEDLGVERISDVASLTCRNREIASLQGITELTALIDLDLSENATIGSFEMLAELPVLRSLTLEAIPLAGVTSLTALSLEYLDVSQASLTSLDDFLPDPDVLRELRLYANSIVDLGALEPYAQLRYLDVQGNAYTIDTFPSSLVLLEELNVIDTGVTSISELPTYLAGNLKRLYIRSGQVSQPVDLSGLDSFDDLNYLNVTYSYVDWESAEGFDATGLELHATGSYFSSLTQLGSAFENTLKLVVDWSYFTDLSGVESLKKLELFAARNANISDINAINTPIEKLYLDDNKITDISSLADVYKEVYTGEISLSGNPIRRVGDVFSDWYVPRVSMVDTDVSCEEIEYVETYLKPQIDVVWPEGCASDPDRDYFYGDEDAFPNDPAASVDTDGDGYPDQWNAEATQEQIDASELVIDAFPTYQYEWLDTDGDGIGNNADSDDDNDGVDDMFDTRPLDETVANLTVLEALNEITDPALRACISNIYTLDTITTDVTGLGCPLNPNIPETPITDITGLSNFRYLTYVWLTEQQITDLDELSKLPVLSRLELRGVPMQNIEFVASLNLYEGLDIEGYEGDKTPLGNRSFGFLTLTVGDSNQDNVALGEVSVGQLAINGVNLNRLDFLGTASISELTLWNASNVDPSGIPHNETLEALVWKSAELSKVEGIANLQALTRLELQNNSLTNLGEITPLQRLSTLDVSNNEIQSLENIPVISPGGKLIVSGNPIWCSQLDIYKSSNPEVELQFEGECSEDPDTDLDGVPDYEDAFPNDPSETTDTDGDGIGNNADTDDDGDGYSDEVELSLGSDPLDPSSVPEEEQSGLPLWLMYLISKP